MSLQISIDRFEGEKKEIAVLITEEGLTANFPRSLLPKDAKPGDILSLSLKVDSKATSKLKEDTKKVQEDLGKTDTGEDIKL